MTEMPELHPVFAKQIDCMMRDDKKGLMEIYHPEVESLRFQGVLKGREAMRKMFADAQDKAALAASGVTAPQCPLSTSSL